MKPNVETKLSEIHPAEKNHVFDLIFGFFDVRVLAVSIEYGIFRRLAQSPASTAELTAVAGIPERGVHFLLITLESMEVIRRAADGTLELTPFGSKFFVESSPWYQGDFVYYAEWVADALPRMRAGLKEDHPIWEAFSHYQKDHAGLADNSTRRHIFNGAMDASARFLAASIVQNCDLSGHKHLLDVGGGHGRIIQTALRHFGHLKATLIDLPDVCAIAETKLTEAGVRDRVTLVPGDFVNDAFPKGHDVVSFVRIFNARPDEMIMALLKKAYDSLPSGGRILIASPFLQRHQSAATRQGARLNMLMWTATASPPHYLDEYTERVTKVGFNRPDQVLADDPYCLLSATKP